MVILQYLWNIYGISMEYLWNIYGNIHGMMIDAGETIIKPPIWEGFIPPIKMVMTGGWFMALFYPH